ncbi:MAG: UDP-3-O-acyl-N-acetylglucosamine deacetylase, partial [Myxococcota bacterium]
LREKVSCVGVGVHCGKPITLEILPAPEGNGITFHRTDLPGHEELRANVDSVVDTTLATTIAAGVNGTRASVSTIEHLMAAFRGLAVDNARVFVDGPEIPILDGSSKPFVDMVRRAGLEAQRRSRRYLVVRKEVRVTEGDKEARIGPGAGLKITCSVDFDHPLIPSTPFTYDLAERTFERDIAPARTFGFLKDVEALRARGLARGGSLENAVVIDEYKVLNPEGLRFPDEFVRHKVLDAIGDLSLFGMPVIGRVHMTRPGHALNTELVKAVLSDPKAFEVLEPEASEAERASRGEPSRLAVLGAVGRLA